MLKVKEGMLLKPEAYTEYVEDFESSPDAEIVQIRPLHSRIDGA